MSVHTGSGALLRSDTKISVSDPEGLRADLGLTVFVDPEVEGPRTVAVSLPGGGYARGYYEINHPALDGEAQAPWHAKRGWVFLSFDPLGSGDSQVVGDGAADFHTSVRIHHLGMTQAIRRVRDGSLVESLGPIEVGQTLGVGHSLGGMQMIAQQGRHHTFDALAVLAFSAIHTVVPAEHGVIESHAVHSVETDESVEEAWGGPLVEDTSHFAYAFFWDDVPRELIEADLGAGFPVRTAEVLPPWVSATFPSCAPVGMSKGVVKQEAAQIRSPLFIAKGERDVIADLRAEASAYPSSLHITLFELLGCAHMHNFSVQRFVLWERLHAWARSLIPSGTSCHSLALDPLDPKGPTG
jgi:hypothetical protein